MLSKQEIDKLDKLVAFACKEAFKDVISEAILYGTTVVTERDGKTVEVDPREFGESSVFGVVTCRKKID